MVRNLRTRQVKAPLAEGNIAERCLAPGSGTLYVRRSVAWHTLGAFAEKHFFLQHMQDSVDNPVPAKGLIAHYKERSHLV